MRRLDKRARATGRLGTKRGERYALLPEEVLQSVAFRELPDYAVRVLVALAAQFNGSNNGSLALTASQCTAYGVRAKQLFAAFELLQLAQLITKTKQGGMRPLGVTRYAVTWRGIDIGDFDPGISPCPLPSHAWAQWAPPASWRDILKTVLAKARGRSTRDKTTLPPVGERPPPPVGIDTVDIAPTCGVSSGCSNAPTRWETSKISGGTPPLLLVHGRRDL